jgi:peptidoglycan hydrolase CwlO-like protein
MGVRCRLKYGLAALLVVLVSLASPVPGALAGPDEPASAPAQTSVSPEEQQVLQELFTLGRSLEETRANMAELDTKIGALTRQQEGARAEMERLEAEREQRQAVLGRRLRYYHEQGRVAPFSVLLGADSFETFLDRLDLLMQVMARDNRLMRELRSLKDEAAQREQELRTAADQLVQLRAELVKSEARLQADIAQREQILSGLRERRAAVEAELAAIEKAWSEGARPVLEALGAALLELDAGSFKPDSVSFSIFPPGATAHISAANLGSFITGQPLLKGLTFRVEPGKVSLRGGLRTPPFGWRASLACLVGPTSGLNPPKSASATFSCRPVRWRACLAAASSTSTWAP